jgi:ATP-dependent Lon protease
MAELRKKIDADVRREIGKEQREAVLREQLRAIKKELGDDKTGTSSTRSASASTRPA